MKKIILFSILMLIVPLISAASYCSDGTPVGECSIDQPKYCASYGLVLIDNCQICGCPVRFKKQCYHDCRGRVISESYLYGACNICGEEYISIGTESYEGYTYITCRKIWETICTENPSCGIEERTGTIESTKCGINYITKPAVPTCQLDRSCRETSQCSDGTYLGYCSTTKPLYCDKNGELINKCDTCGCAESSTDEFTSLLCLDEYTASGVWPFTPSCSSGYSNGGTISIFPVYKIRCQKTWETDCSENPSCGIGKEMESTECASECQLGNDCKEVPIFKYTLKVEGTALYHQSSIGRNVTCNYRCNPPQSTTTFPISMNSGCSSSPPPCENSISLAGLSCTLINTSECPCTIITAKSESITKTERGSMEEGFDGVRGVYIIPHHITLVEYLKYFSLDLSPGITIPYKNRANVKVATSLLKATTDLYGDNCEPIGPFLSCGPPPCSYCPPQKCDGYVDVLLSAALDSDEDGVANYEDNCPTISNSGQEDSDNDGIGNACDKCVNTPSTEISQIITDNLDSWYGCGSSERDTDGDGDYDSSDCNPYNPYIHHGADERCNNVDEDCDGLIDEDCNATIPEDNDTIPEDNVTYCRWENLDGEKISQANKGDTVRMVLTDANSGEFKIYEKDFSTNDYIWTVEGTLENGKVIAYWTITAEDLELTDDYEDFYFEVDGNNEKRSNYLSISENSDDKPTVITIISPNCGDYFNAGLGEVNIIISADDDDDLIDGTLSIDGSQIATFDNEGVTTSYIFSTGGNYKIVAEGTNSRGKKSRTISNVMAIDTTIDGEYVAACITKPEDYSNIPTSSVEFDASDSLGIKYNAGTTTVIDLSGLNFDWSFSDGRTNPHHLGTDEKSYKFPKNFNNVGSNWATLQVSII